MTGWASRYFMLDGVDRMVKYWNVEKDKHNPPEKNRKIPFHAIQSCAKVPCKKKGIVRFDLTYIVSHQTKVLHLEVSS